MLTFHCLVFHVEFFFIAVFFLVILCPSVTSYHSHKRTVFNCICLSRGLEIVLRTCSILPGSVTANLECNQLSNSNTYNTGAIFQTCPNKVHAELALCLGLPLQKRSVGKIKKIVISSLAKVSVLSFFKCQYVLRSCFIDNLSVCFLYSFC